MAKMRSRDAYKEALKAQVKNKLLANPNTPYGLAVTLRTYKGGKRGGYLNALNRLQKKVKAPLKGIPSCGPRLKEWLTGY